MTLTILSDTDVREVLHALTLDDVKRLQQRLAEALHEYSTGTQATTGGCSANQPARTHVTTPDGLTTLFMPARTGATAGVKIVSLQAAKASAGTSVPSSQEAQDNDDSDTEAGSISSGKGSLGAALSRGGSSSGRSSPAPGSSMKLALRTSNSDSQQSADGRSLSPATASSTTLASRGSGGSGRSSPAPMPVSLPALQSCRALTRGTSPKGSLTLLKATGEPLALINAAELTAFRTALASTVLFSKRSRVHSIAVFGAGKQAYWHLRLALLLRGSEIHHVRLINRTFEGAAPLLKDIYQEESWESLRRANKKLTFSPLSADYGEYSRVLKDYVRDADALFCCTPATAPLFPAGYLTRPEGRKKGRYLSMVGSYAPHMHEVHHDILRQAVAPDHGHHHHRHPTQSGVVVVDSLDACMRESGEIIAANLTADQLVEVGEIIMVKRAAMKEVQMGQPGEPGLVRWLEQGNVIYKSVGLGLMDLAVGEELVAVAREKGVGTQVENF